MAKFERPTDTYTPTQGTLNLNKYNDDSTAIPPVPISSTKVDADINRLIDAVNDIDQITGGTGEADLDGAVTNLNSRVTTNEADIANLTAGTVPDADYGDITVSSGATQWTIDDNAVTEAKLAVAVQDKLNEVAQQETFVSTGTSTAGEVAVLKADGTVGAVEVDVDSFNELYTGAFSATKDVYLKNIYHEPTSQVVIIDEDGTNIKATICTADETSPTFGSPITIDALSGYVIRSVTMDGNNNIVVCLTKSTQIRLVRISVTTGSASLLNSTEWTPPSANGIQEGVCTYDANGDAIVIGYRGGTLPQEATVVAATSPSGTGAFSFGTPVTVGGSDSAKITLAYSTTSLKTVVAYIDNAADGVSSSADVRANVLTLTGTTISAGAKSANINIDTSGNLVVRNFIDYNADADNFLLSMGRGGNVIMGAIISISGTSIVVDDNADLLTGSLTDNANKYLPQIGRFAFCSTVSGQKYFISIDTSGGAINAGAPEIVTPLDTVSSNEVVETNTSGVFLLSDRDGVTVIKNATDADNYIGINQNTALDGENVNVIMYGGTAKNLSGLTVNTNYFVDDDGSLITTDNGRFIGKAVKVTTLNMNRP